jgi:hypothetical protein
MTWALGIAVLVVWFVLAAVVTVGVGRAVMIADRKEAAESMSEVLGSCSDAMVRQPRKIASAQARRTLAFAATRPRQL